MARMCKAIILVILTVASTCWAKTTEERIEACRDAFNASLSDIQANHETQIKRWPGGYLRALAELEKEERDKGELNTILLIRKEAERFRKEPSLANTRAEWVGLSTLQDEHRKKKDRIVMERDEGILALRDKYVTYLEDVKKRLTKSGKIDDAILIDKAIKDFKSRVEVTSAEFTLALQTTRDKPAAPPVAPAQPKPTEKPAKEASEVPEPSGPAKITQSSSGVKFDAGARRPASSRGALKTLPVRGTSLARLQRSLTCIAYVDKTASTERTSSTSRSTSSYANAYSSGSSTSSSHATKLALVMRARRSDEVHVKPKVIILYFATEERGDSSEPHPIASHYAELSHLDASGGCLYFPAVSTRSYAYRYVNRYSHQTSRSGTVFYGVLISIVDANGSILYQAASKAKLEDYAEIALEEHAKIVKAGAVDTARQAYDKARQTYTAAVSAYSGSGGNQALRAAMEAAREEMNKARQELSQAQSNR